MQTMMKWSPLESGLILLPGGLIMGLLSPVTGKLFDKNWWTYLGVLWDANDYDWCIINGSI